MLNTIWVSNTLCANKCNWNVQVLYIALKKASEADCVLMNKGGKFQKKLQYILPWWGSKQDNLVLSVVLIM